MKENLPFRSKIKLCRNFGVLWSQICNLILKFLKLLILHFFIICLFFFVILKNFLQLNIDQIIKRWPPVFSKNNQGNGVMVWSYLFKGSLSFYNLCWLNYRYRSGSSLWCTGTFWSWCKRNIIQTWSFRNAK